jgi:hypothetical protein
MKKNFIFQTLVLLFCALSATAQQGINYKAIINDSNGDVLAITPVTVQFTILENGTTNVFQETHGPTTDANGIIIVNIGEGTPISGDFNTIDWGSTPHFLKTEINSGDGLTDMGTTEFKAVPYALHAKTVESITETDPVFSASQAAHINIEDSLNLAQLSGTNTGDQDLSGYATHYHLGDTAASIRSDFPDVSNLALKSNVLELDNTTAFTPDADYEPATKKYVDDNAAGATTYSVGDFAQGGIVFWVDETGQHGLLCAKVDQSTGVRWFSGTIGSTQAKGDGPFSGEVNTAIIIAAHVAIGDDGSTYAARICNELQITEGGKTYGDWYLPSKEELNLMYQNKATINSTALANSGSAFTSVYYWSSTEVSDVGAYELQFLNGYYYGGGNKHVSDRVRAVRAF